MVRNYLRVALRNLIRNKGFSLLSIIGLSAGMSVCLLIITFVKQQKSYDRFHNDADRIYHIYSDYKAPVNKSSHLYGTSPAGLGQALNSDLPGVTDFVTLRRFGGEAVARDQTLSVRGLYASESFFKMFGFTLLKGSPKTVLSQPWSIVLTQETAKKFFGEAEPLGQTVTLKDGKVFVVTGITRPPDQPTIFEFEALASFSTLQTDAGTREQLAPWDRTVRNSYTFVKLQEGASASDLETQMPAIIKQHFPGDDTSRLVALHVQKLTDVAFGPIMDNQLKFMLPPIVLYILAGLAAVVLLSACFNYVSLALARALRRAKEVGVRKVVGAQRSQIVSQFLVEAACVALLAVLGATLMLGWFVQGFNQLTPIQFTKGQILPDFGDASLYMIFVGFALVVGLLSGLYPALYLSSFFPTVVLRGIARVRRRGFTLRKTLIVTQFTFSLLFIISTLLLYQQSKFVGETNYGFNPGNIINVKLEGVPYQAFRNELLNKPGVVDVSAVSILTGSGGRSDVWLQSDSLAEHEKGYSVWIDKHTIPNLEIPLLAGRNFSSESAAGEQRAVLLNETAVRVLQLGTPRDAVGQLITVDDSTDMQVIGVVKDYRFFSALSGIDPLVLRYDPGEWRIANIRFQAADFDNVVGHLKAVWSKFKPDVMVETKLYTDYLAEAFELKPMRDFLHIIALVAGFAILIACLGLLGMTANMTETRLKEIGVRKVLGGTTAGIVALLSKAWGTLVLMAVAAAVPLSYFVNNLWLQNLGNRIDMTPVPFLIGILLLFLISALTIGSQTLRAARTNPTEILKYE